MFRELWPGKSEEHTIRLADELRGNGARPQLRTGSLLRRGRHSNLSRFAGASVAGTRRRKSEGPQFLAEREGFEPSIQVLARITV
jgi:hypothetical protein